MDANGKLSKEEFIEAIMAQEPFSKMIWRKKLKHEEKYGIYADEDFKCSHNKEI